MTSITRQRQILVNSVRIVIQFFNVSHANGVAAVTHITPKLGRLGTNRDPFSLAKNSRFCVESMSNKLVAPVFCLKLENTLLAKYLPD